MSWKGLEYSNQEFWRFDFVLGVSCCALHLQALLTVKQYTNANCCTVTYFIHLNTWCKKLTKCIFKQVIQMYTLILKMYTIQIDKCFHSVAPKRE